MPKKVEAAIIIIENQPICLIPDHKHQQHQLAQILLKFDIVTAEYYPYQYWKPPQISF